ncbi:MAG: 2-iminoacetate synthase ThiH [Desulfobacterales bacterium]|nr:2-iminoacetate synthase ThiH [Desulfobacterales bacterium]
MNFYSKILNLQNFDFNTFFKNVTKSQIFKILEKNRIDENDFLALLSPVAEDYLEDMAQKSKILTQNNFGKTISLYTPLYLSNYCKNRCVYCGFNTESKQLRKQLSFDDVYKEASIISSTGLKHILILTGDSREKSSVQYIKKCIEILKEFFDSIAIEIYALETDEYKELNDAGADSLTIYQETYNESLYKDLHLKGPKRDYEYRINAPERGAVAGMHSINIAALLGLDDFRRDAFFTGIHADYLQQKYPAVEIGISMPRIRPVDGGFKPLHNVSDRNLLQFITAFRIFMPRCGITISTRENEKLRDNLLPLGVTKMSAGSTTTVGGHSDSEDESKQFEISDKRSVSDMMSAIKSFGYQPVFKDWEQLNL